MVKYLCYLVAALVISSFVAVGTVTAQDRAITSIDTHCVSGDCAKVQVRSRTTVRQRRVIAPPPPVQPKVEVSIDVQGIIDVADDIRSDMNTGFTGVDNRLDNIDADVRRTDADVNRGFDREHRDLGVLDGDLLAINRTGQSQLAVQQQGNAYLAQIAQNTKDTAKWSKRTFFGTLVTGVVGDIFGGITARNTSYNNQVVYNNNGGGGRLNCPRGTIEQFGRCVTVSNNCPYGMDAYGRCIQQPPTCSPGFYLVNGQCVPSGPRRVCNGPGPGCQPLPICPPGNPYSGMANGGPCTQIAGNPGTYPYNTVNPLTGLPGTPGTNGCVGSNDPFCGTGNVPINYGYGAAAPTTYNAGYNAGGYTSTFTGYTFQQERDARTAAVYGSPRQ